MNDIITAERQRTARLDELTDHYREDTGKTVVCAFLFGPFYFAWFGFWGRAAVTLLSAILFPLNLIVAPAIARQGWRDRARARAERALDLHEGAPRV